MRNRYSSLLQSFAECSDLERINTMETKKKLYIDAGTVIVNLLNEEKSEYLTLKRLDRLVDYIYEQLLDNNLIRNYQDVIFNVNFDAVERTVLFNNQLFELVGDTIILKYDYIPKEVADKYKSDECILEIIHRFINEGVA